MWHLDGGGKEGRREGESKGRSEENLAYVKRMPLYLHTYELPISQTYALSESVWQSIKVKLQTPRLVCAPLRTYRPG